MPDGPSDPRPSRFSAQPTRQSAGAPVAGAPGARAPGARFAPGSVLGTRYRIVACVGRGGMGDVYRAEDLRLGQTVALKFLPERVASDASRLERLRGEVRLARQVSHANVCRVFDLAEVDGHTFIVMEFVEGEDLSSVLRRIGRLPGEKAVQVARQLCAALHAAHEKGVIHRDLKPANVMLDERGHARLTDFGLAAIVHEIDPEEARTGTPAYMAPEQLEGGPITVRTDLYALGLVLYELFTGRHAFEDETLAKARGSRASTTPLAPRSVVQEIDPAAERAILRCLEYDPMNRPRSALAVAASLPGGDPLAAALAAGETPSPAMVAAAGGEGTMRVGPALACLAVVVGVIVLHIALSPWTTTTGTMALPLRPEALAQRARDAVVALGGPETIKDSAWGVWTGTDVLGWAERHEESGGLRDALAWQSPSAVNFWYREADAVLQPESFANKVFGEGRVWSQDPPRSVEPGMTSLNMWADGSLHYFFATSPLALKPTAEGVAPDWSVAFRLAGLDPAKFAPVEPSRRPPGFAERRLAWEGPFEKSPYLVARVEAASVGDRVVYFDVFPPWTAPTPEAAEASAPPGAAWRIGQVLIPMTFIGWLGLTVALGWRNVRMGRFDRKGALRLGVVLTIVYFLRWALVGRYRPATWDMFVFDVANTLPGLGFLLIIIVGSYIALEPVARRLWPQCLVGWSRLLQGRWRDPRVGRDVLIGATAGAVCVALGLGRRPAQSLLGGPAEWPILTDIEVAAHGPAWAVFQFLKDLEGNFLMTVVLLAVLIIGRAVFRLRVVAFALALVVAAFFTEDRWGPVRMGWSGWVFTALGAAISVGVLTRVGVLAKVALGLVWSTIYFAPVHNDLSVWWAPGMLTRLGLAAAVAVYGFVVATGAKAILTDEVLMGEKKRSRPTAR